MDISALLNVLPGAATLIGPGGFYDGAGNLLIPSIDNRNNGEKKDIVGGRVSLYTSGRVGYEASRGNYALFERDVPYIFNEIIFGLDGSGRDNQNQIRLSINKTWNGNGTDSGLIYFNEIRIYSRRNGFQFYELRKEYRLDGQAGMLRPFIFHVPLGQFPSIEPTASVPNPQ